MKVYVLMFGAHYDGYDANVRVFASKEAAEKEGERVVAEDEYIDFYNVEEVEVE
jgi:hypothetical protein